MNILEDIHIFIAELDEIIHASFMCGLGDTLLSGEVRKY